MEINDFKQLSVNDIQEYQKCISGRYNNSESSVASMFTWQHYYGASFTVSDDTIYSLFKDGSGNYASFMPYGEHRNSVEAIDKLIEFYSHIAPEFTLNLCTSDFVEFLNSVNHWYDYEVTEKRNSFDYVYNTSDLINLSGKKYHSKKNHINTFNKLYAYEYVRYDNSMKSECVNFCAKVLAEHYRDNVKSYNAELESIQKAFDSFDVLRLKCGLLCADNKIIALSVGEKLNNDYALIHIEKADYNYRTAYSVINNLFLKNEFADTIYVNREEDMGIEGIRKAKMSYKPCFLIEKYNIKFKIF